MDGDQGNNCKPCVDQGPESIHAERQAMLPGNDTMAIESTLQCCICRQLLDEPMLLQCLHSCCRRCLKSASPIHEPSEVAPLNVEHSSTVEVFGLSSTPAFAFQQSSQSVSSVCCQTCMETTNVAAAVDNAFLAAKVRAIKVRCDLATCAFCGGDEEDVGAARSASFWCGACQSTLCADCVRGLHRKFHKTHLTTSLHELQCGDQAIGISTVSCVKHGRPYELACFTCETAHCLSCTADCIAARHDMLLLSDPRFASRFAQLKLRVAELSSSVRSKSAVLQQHVDMAERLRAARQADLDQLKANKRAVVDAIDQAYQEAESTLKDGYDELEAKAIKLRRAAEQKLEQVRNAVDYSQQILAADSEIIALMQQQELIVSNLNALQKILESTSLTRDACTFFEVPKCTESIATQLVAFFLPKPQLKSDELCVDPAARVKSSSFCFAPLFRASTAPTHHTLPSLLTTATPEAKIEPSPLAKLPTHHTLPSLLTTPTPEAKMQPSPLAQLSSPEPAVVSATGATSSQSGIADAAATIGASLGTWQELFLSTKSPSAVQFGAPVTSSGGKKPSSSRFKHSGHK